MNSIPSALSLSGADLQIGADQCQWPRATPLRTSEPPRWSHPERPNGKLAPVRFAVRKLTYSPCDATDLGTSAALLKFLHFRLLAVVRTVRRTRCRTPSSTITFARRAGAARPTAHCT